SDLGIAFRRDADAVRKAGRATASENANLLAEMLREQGYEVKFVHGQAVFKEQQVKWLTGASSIDKGADVYKENGIKYTKLLSDGKTIGLIVEHIWVRAYLPVTDYRGAKDNAGEYAWIDLDAYAKNQNLSQVDTLTLLPFSLQFETRGLNGSGEPKVTDTIPEELKKVDNQNPSGTGNPGGTGSTTETPINEDSTGLTALMEYPEDEDTITALTDIVGTVCSDAENVEYTLGYRPNGKGDYKIFYEGKESVNKGKLGAFDSSLLANGKYQIRLSVKDGKGHSKTVTRKVNIEGALKVGNMHIGFTDITSKITGTTVNVNRIYDSTVKESGDFGYGWSMSVQGLKIYESASLADGYGMVQSGSGFSTRYQMVEKKDHDVTVTYGDGTSDRFELTFSPAMGVLRPIQEVTLGYKCVTNQKVKLEILTDTSGAVSGGNILFYEDGVYDTINYRLTTENGEKLYLNKNKGVYRIEDSLGHKITVDANGYHGEDGRSIEVKRDSKNRVTEATDVNGNKTIYKYDAAGDLVSVTDSADRTVSYTYDKNHNLISIIDPMGVAVSRNEYDSEGRLIATIDADGNRMEFSHDVEGRQEIVKDRRGNSTVYIYDDNGNVLQTIDALGNKTTNEYDNYNNVIKTTDALGHVTTFRYDNEGNILSRVNGAGEEISANYNDNKITSIVKDGIVCADIKYDNNDNITSVEDSDHNVTEFTYDANGNNTSAIDALGTIVSYKYDENNNVIESKDGDGNITKFVRNDEGKCTQISKVQVVNGVETTVDSFLSYDNAGNVTEKVDSLGNKVHYTYDAVDNVSSMTDMLGNETKYEYDDLGNLTKILYSDGTSESFAYDANGNTITATNTYGVKVNMTYDKLDRMTSKEYVGGGKEVYTYDAVGNVIAKAVNGNTTKYEYDGIGRNTAVIDPYGNKTTFEYDNKSNLIKKIDALGNTWSYTYDAKGNQTSFVRPDGNKETSEYDVRGQVKVKTDFAGNLTRYSYDAAGHLTEVKDVYGNTTTYEYDGLGNVTKVTDANGHSYKYEYDSLSRVTKKTNALGKSCTYEYDALGNIVKNSDYDGNVTENTYDGHGRIIKSSVSGNVTTYSYEDASGKDIDRLASVTNKEGTIKYQYDNQGRIISKIDTNNIKLEYEYTLNGKLSKLSTPYGATSYEYDKMDRIVRVVDHNGNVTLYTYDKIGNRETLTYSNGLQAKYKYDKNSYLSRIDIVDSKKNVIKSYIYQRNKKGYPSTIQETDSEGTKRIEYRYDGLNRLLYESTWDNNGRITYNYTYDKVGNRLSKTVDFSNTVSGLIDSSSNLKAGKTTYKYNENNQLVSEECSGEKTEYSYDDNGNLISVTNGNTVQSYEYNYQNKLSVYKNSAGKEFTYSYDAQGNRISKSSATGVIKYVVTTFDDLSNVILELDKDNKQIKHYTIGEDLLGVDISGTDYSYIQDGHGNVAFLTDSNGEFVNKYTYDAFGNSLICSEKVSNSFRYNSENYDEESGLYYLRARYMNPATGTFTQEDTYQGNIYDAISLHKYLFAAANPVVFEDPSGKFFLTQLSLTTAIEKILSTRSQLFTFHKGIEITKKAVIATNLVNIGLAFKDLLLDADSPLDILKDVADIGFSLLTIFTVCGIVEESKFIIILSVMGDWYGLGSDIVELIMAIKNKEWPKVAWCLICLSLDITFSILGIGEANADTINIVNARQMNKNYSNTEAIFELAYEAKCNGGLTDDVCEILYDWSKEYNSFNKVRLLLYNLMKK
ncbi:MAG: RHS repeat protein, partial [Eubacterium sp.]|nr:RHS repeat protein [Eubacterium sp.]